MIKEHYDIAVVGGGPAGMLAAGMAAKNGAKVALIEKNGQLGRKLLITGKGRCNITRKEENLRLFIEAFGRKGNFLYPALHAFGVEDTVKFFNGLGLATKVERGKRVFPQSDKAQDVLDALIGFLKENKVDVRCGFAVEKVLKNKGSISGIITKDQEIIAVKYILCTGGLSYPQTGSSGDGYKWAGELGHTIISPRPALVPIKVKETFLKELEGLSLKNVAISVWQNAKKRSELFGEALFTAEGMSGPIILDLSRVILDLPKARTELHLDLKPALDGKKLDDRIQRDLKKYGNKMFRNSLDDLLPQKLIPVIVRLSGIGPSKQSNSVTKEERKRLVGLLKCLNLTVSGLAGFEKAVITTGGVCLNEIDQKTMRSKIIKNLYFAGEILDLDGPTGGYNLQVCWSTGFLAGASAADSGEFRAKICYNNRR